MTFSLPEGFENRIICAERNKILNTQIPMLTTGAFISNMKIKKSDLVTSSTINAPSSGSSNPVGYNENTLSYNDRIETIKTLLVDVTYKERVELDLALELSK